MAMSTEHTNQIAEVVIHLPVDLRDQLREQAAGRQRTLNDEIIDAVRHHLGVEAVGTDDEALLREAIAEADRGATQPLRPDAMATLRKEIRRGASADEALAR